MLMARERHASTGCLLKGVSAFLLASVILGGFPEGLTALQSTPMETARLEAELIGKQLLNVMRSGDVEGLIAMLHDQISFMGDAGTTKLELAKQLRNKEGHTYAFLFDSKRWAAIVEEAFEWDSSPELRKRITPVMAVRDHLLRAKAVQMRVAFMTGETGPPSLAIVGYDWPGRPGLYQVGNCVFLSTPDGWKLNNLFRFPAWGMSAR